MAIQDDFDRLKTFCEGPFAGLCTPAEFAELHGVDESAVRHAIRSGRLRPGSDCFKFGKQWVLSKYAFANFPKNGSFQKVSELNLAFAKAKTESAKNVTLP